MRHKGYDCIYQRVHLYLLMNKIFRGITVYFDQLLTFNTVYEDYDNGRNVSRTYSFLRNRSADTLIVLNMSIQQSSD